MTKRAEDNKLLESFRSGARSNGAQEEAQHANQLVTVQLTERDYDIELATDYSAQAQQQSRTLAQHFVEWWDGDHGKTASPGTSWSSELRARDSSPNASDESICVWPVQFGLRANSTPGARNA